MMIPYCAGTLRICVFFVSIVLSTSDKISTRHHERATRTQVGSDSEIRGERRRFFSDVMAAMAATHLLAPCLVLAFILVNDQITVSLAKLQANYINDDWTSLDDHPFASNPDFPAQIAVNCFNISITAPAASNVTGRLKISETDRNLGSALQARLSAWVIGPRLVLCTNSYLCGNCDGFGFLSNCILISMRLGSHCTRSNANLVLLWGSQRSQGKRRMSYRRKFHKGPTLYYPNSSATFHTTTYLNLCTSEPWSQRRQNKKCR